VLCRVKRMATAEWEVTALGSSSSRNRCICAWA
jgi:hypothetical protein